MKFSSQRFLGAISPLLSFASHVKYPVSCTWKAPILRFLKQQSNCGWDLFRCLRWSSNSHLPQDKSLLFCVALKIRGSRRTEGWCHKHGAVLRIEVPFLEPTSWPVVARSTKTIRLHDISNDLEYPDTSNLKNRDQQHSSYFCWHRRDGTAYCSWSVKIFQSQSQSHRCLFNGTWQKRPRELDHRLRFEIEEMTLQMKQAVLSWMPVIRNFLVFATILISTFST